MPANIKRDASNHEAGPKFDFSHSRSTGKTLGCLVLLNVLKFQSSSR